MMPSPRYSAFGFLILCQLSILIAAYDCNIPPLSLKIQNISLDNGIAINRGIGLQLPGEQYAGLRFSFTWNNTRIRSNLDCSYIDENISQYAACQGVSGSVFDPLNPGFNRQLSNSWDFEVETVDTPPPGAQLEYGVALTKFEDGPSFELPVEVWSSPVLTKDWSDWVTPQRSFLALGPQSSLLERLLDLAYIPSRGFGLYYGSRSVKYPTDGELILGGYDTARMAGPLMNFSIAAFPMNVPCPLRVQVRSVTLNNVNGPFELLNHDELVPACVDPLQNAFTFNEAMYSRWAELTNHSTIIDGEQVDSQTYLAENEELMGTLMIGLDNGFNVTIPHYELVSPERGVNLTDGGHYVVKNSSRIQSAVKAGKSDIDADIWMLLGGIFLSSTYLLVDYERNKFGLAEANKEPQISAFQSICSDYAIIPPHISAVLPNSFSEEYLAKKFSSAPIPGELGPRDHIQIIIGIFGAILAAYIIIWTVSIIRGEIYSDVSTQGSGISDAENYSILDKFKNSIQGATPMPIIWWPLKSPRVSTANRGQVSWNCETCSGPFSGIALDMQSGSQKENRYNIQVDEEILSSSAENACSLTESSHCYSSRAHKFNSAELLVTFHPDANYHVELPTSSTWASSTSTLANSATGSESATNPDTPEASIRQDPQKVSSVSHSPKPPQPKKVSKWVHWCVGTAKTRVIDICVEGQEEVKTGQEFIEELKRSYRRMRGLRWWFSLKECASIKFVKFAMILDDQDLVSCSPEPVTIKEIRAAPKYEIDTDDMIDDTFHIKKVEDTLTHLLQQHGSRVQDRQVNVIISGLPKERMGSLDTPGSPCKYGIRSIHGWSVLRILWMFALWIFPGLIFFFLWLVKHPGDLQTASVPYLMLLTTFPIIIPVLDLYTE